jgi:hypothetical protein
MHFGLHLYRKGTITADELVAALELQEKRPVRLGQLALEEGILSVRDVFDVLRAQHHAPHDRFGELAIEMGRMKRADLARLLMAQADRKVPLSDLLVCQGILSRRQADAELEAYRQAQLRPRHEVRTTTIVRTPHHRAADRKNGRVAIETTIAT